MHQPVMDRLVSGIRPNLHHYKQQGEAKTQPERTTHDQVTPEDIE
jgi:hypothetical protein